MITNLLKNKSIKNGIWLYLFQFFHTVLPLFTIPYITRVLGRGNYGTFSIILNYVGYLQVLIEYGFGMSASREVAVSNKEKKELSTIFTGVILSRMVLMLLSIMAVVFYIWITDSDLLIIRCFSVMMLCLTGYVFQQNWFFQGMQEMKYISVIGIATRSISTLLVFIMVKTSNDLLLYCLLYTIAPFLNGIIGTVISVKKYGLRLVKVDRKMILDKLKSGWYVFTTQLSSKVFGAVGVTILGFFVSDIEVGMYSAIQKIPQIILLAWAPISQVLYPLVSQKMQVSFAEGERFVTKTRRIILPFFSFGSLLIALFSRTIVGILFGVEYVEKYYWVIPLLVWVLISIINNFMGIQTLLASSHDKEYSACFQIGVLVTIIVNLLLISMFGGNGAAFAPVVSELFLSILLYNNIRRIRMREYE